MAIGLFIAFALGAAFGYIMCAVLSANTTDEEWQKIAGVPAQPTVPPMPKIYKDEGTRCTAKGRDTISTSIVRMT